MLYTRIFEEDVNSSEWDILIRNLDSFRIKIDYEKDSEFESRWATVHISGVGKEQEPISSWIEVLSFIDRILRKWYNRNYSWHCVNHGTGLRIDIISKK